jgi:hypothetical protein
VHAGARNQLTGSLRTIAMLARVSLLLFALPVLLSLLITLFVFAMPIYGYLASRTVGVIGTLALPLLALCALFVGLWIYRAHANLFDFGLPGLAYSPGWSVGSLFVPFVNLLVPMRAMRELWNRSHGEDEYQAAMEVPIVSAWWACFVGGVFLAAIQYVVFAINVLTNIEFITPPLIEATLGVLGQAMLLVSILCLFRIITAITRAQRVEVGVSNAFA